MSLGMEPGTSVVVRARVGPLASLETIEAKGTAVGFVDKRVTVILGVDTVLVVTVEPLTGMEGMEPDVDDAEVVVGPEVGCEVALEEAWRA